MYCVKIIYPRKKETYFKFDHYFNVHLPLALKAIKPYANVLKVEVDKGCGGMTGESDMPYHCICSVYFESESGHEGFRNLFANPEDGKPLADDIPKYTNTTPEFQFSETIDFSN